MESSTQLLVVEKSKKTTSLRSFLDAKCIDRNKIREYFLENFSNIPQELRLLLWKIILGISSSFHNQNASLDKILDEHYQYLRHIILEVIQINTRSQEEINYFIYLLDRDYLPVDNYQDYIKDSNSFILINKQLNEILDDQSDFESYYLTTELYELLRKNLNNMKEKFSGSLTHEVPNKASIEQINIEPFLLCGLAGFFNDVKIYHIMWDRLVMGEFEILSCVLLSFLETCKEDQLKQIKNFTYKQFNLIQKFGLDEVKILKKTTKYYKKPSISSMIVNYFNSK